MKLLEKLKYGSVYLRPLLLLVIFLLVALIAFLFSNLYVAQAQPGFAGFEPASGDINLNGNSQALAVWVDVSPSMYGFLHSNRAGCIPSSYRMLLTAMPDIAQKISKVSDVAYYRFDSTFALSDTDLSEQARTDVRNAHHTSASAVENPKQYQNLPTSGGSSSALPAVLNALDLSTPALILTDFEDDGLTQTSAKYEQSLQRIFDAGYCISVVAMKSAFSGMLFNYTNEGIDYTYGTALNSSSYKDAIQIAASYPNHNHPRPFYAIVVGTAQQCEDLRVALTENYTSNCQTNITDKADTFKQQDSHRGSTTSFVEVKSADYWLNDDTCSLNGVDGASVSVTAEAGLTRNANSPWNNQGTLEYSIQKSSEEATQKASIAFHIVPDMACYATTFPSDVIAVSKLSVQKISTNKVVNKNLEEDKKTLLGRGDRRIVLKMESFDDQNHWFACSDIQKAADGVTFTLNINVTDSEPGLYRILLPVTCIHSTEVADQGEISWIKNWSLRSVDLKAKLHAGEETAAKTANLSDQMSMIQRIEVIQSSRREYPLASLTVDLKIE